MSSRKTVHIDGDILVYSVGFASEKGNYTISWQPDGVEEVQQVFQYKKDLDFFIHELGNKPFVVEFERTPEPVEFALHSLKQSVQSIRDETEADDFYVYLTGPTNFRNELATIKPYKGNRDTSHKPVHGPAIREYMERHYPTLVSDNEEADDLLGYHHYAMYKADPESSILATRDKDLNMIPGHHYNFGKKEFYYVDDDEADFFFYKQLLTGDSTDNIQGVPGIGPRKAEKLLNHAWGSPAEMYEICRQAYGFNQKDLEENARLLWIRREKGEIWSPPTLQTESLSTSTTNEPTN